MKNKSRNKIIISSIFVVVVLAIGLLVFWLIWGNVRLINFSNDWSVNHALAADPNAPITILAEADYEDYKFILYTDPIDESENIVHNAHFQKQPGFPNSYALSGGGSTNNPMLRIDPVEEGSNTCFIHYSADYAPTTWSLFEIDYNTNEVARKVAEIDTPQAPFVIVETFDFSLDDTKGYEPVEGTPSLEEVRALYQQYMSGE